MNLYGIFPTPVAKFELGRDFTSAELNLIASFSTTQNVGNTTSSDRYVLRSDTFSDLRAFIQLSTDKYFESIYAPKEKVKLRITQSWVNYSKPGQWHHLHAHPNSFVSGVLYLKAAKERDRIYFHKNNYEQLKVETNTWNLYNSESWWFEAATGELIIFPSYLSHKVDVVQESERISLSFNTFPVGYLGQEDSLTALHLE